MNKKLINVVKGDINTALENGNYNRNTTYQTNIEFNTPTKLILLDGIPYSSPLLTKVTWQELKNKRDAGKLIPGSLYRITDYQCTTTEENTRSAGYQFDIILLALSENKLAEEGWAMMHDNDVYDVIWAGVVNKKAFITITSDDIYYVEVNNTTKGISLNNLVGEIGLTIDECVTINDDAKTVKISFDYENLANISNIWQSNIPYNYFQNSKLSAWKVWYCLDNDSARFGWADDSVDEYIESVDGATRYTTDMVIDGVNYYSWKQGNFSTWYTRSEYPEVGDTKYGTNPVGTAIPIGTISNIQKGGTGLPNGRGVIYRLIDEWNNDCPYDFKNIQFIRPMTRGVYDPNGEDTWVYTFTNNKNGVLKDASFSYYDEGLGFTVVWAYSNYIGCYFDQSYFLSNNVFINEDVVYSNKLYNSNNNTFSGSFSSVLYNSNNLDNIDAQSIYIAGKKVLTES